MPDGTLLGAHYDGGVQARPSDYDANTWEWQQIVEVSATEDQAGTCFDFLTAQVGKHYDLHAVADIAVAWAKPGVFRPIRANDWRDPTQWFCSELVAAALEEAGLLYQLATQISCVTPCILMAAVTGRYPSTSPVQQRVQS